MTVAVALACGNVLGETAAWSVREGVVYWVDIRDALVHRLHPETGAHRSWPMPELTGAVMLASVGVVVALRRGLVHLDTETGAITPLCTVEEAHPNNRLNEAKCDRAGRLWVGSMRDYGLAKTGSLYRIGPDRRAARVLDGIAVPNSLCWSQDGCTTYFADTKEGSLLAYDTDPRTAELGPPRIFLPPDRAPGRPDGATVDSEGFVWNTRFGAGLVIRIAPDGRVVDRIALPATQPTSCTLGGPTLRTLYVTTARQRLSPADLAEQPLAGHLFAVPVDVPGLTEPEFPMEALVA